MLGGASVSLAPLVGCPFGSCFTLAERALVRAPPPPAAPRADLAADERSNKHLQDDSSAQALSGAAIAALKARGATGDAVVAALVASSATFDTKTAFSQDKYLARKKRKHCAAVAALRPTGPRVCAVLFAKTPDRVAYLRPDALAAALAAADAGAGGRMLVLDGAGGLPAGAALERLWCPGGGGAAAGADAGAVVIVHAARAPPSLDCVRFFNFPEEALALLWRAPLEALEAAAAAAAAPSTAPAPAAAAALEAAPAAAADADAPAADGGDAAARRRPLPACSSGRVQPAGPAQLSSWVAAGGFTSLLAVAPAFEPEALLTRLLPLLVGGAPFALFANCLEPLAEAADALRASRAAVCVEIHEPWLREYQVLPSRTHPHMGMSATAGYLLTGVRVLPAAPDAPRPPRGPGGGGGGGGGGHGKGGSGGGGFGGGGGKRRA
jgi:tRNA (adenine-N(1)-)-methyltransferase non-catalytic subunit